MTKQDLYSYHVFLFPFQWYYTGKDNKGITFEEKTRLKPFMDKLEAEGLWKRSFFKLDSRLKYNEANYFHDFVRDILYDYGDDPLKGFIANYEYDIPQDDWTYRIEVKLKDHIKEYVLHVDSILLHLYNNGVGVISIHLNNRILDQSSSEDILNINKYGRRLYVPYFGIPSDIIGTNSQYATGNFYEGLSIVEGIEMPVSITIGHEGLKEDFSRYSFFDSNQNRPFIIPRFISGLFGNINLTNRKDIDEDGIHLSPLLDDRMFVICWYGNNEIVQKINANSELKGQDSEGKYLYKSDPWWYQFVFVDSGGTSCQNNEMSEKLLTNATNARWVNYGTLYGITRYSFVCLSSDLNTLKNHNAAYLLNHVQTMYYKMAELALVQRSCVLRFADEVTEISSLDDKDLVLLSKNVSNLYLQYIRFVNKIYFREITPQEQGIELYDKLQEAMCLNKHVEDLDNEIAELHTYVGMEEERSRNRNLETLTKLGAAFIIPGFIAGFLGMNLFEKPNYPIPKSVAIIIAIMVLPLGVFYIFNKNNRNNIHFISNNIIFTTIVLIFYLLIGILAITIY